MTHLLELLYKLYLVHVGSEIRLLLLNINAEIVVIGSHNVTVYDVYSVAHGAKVVVSEDTLDKVDRARQVYIEECRRRRVYGCRTGVGALQNLSIECEEYEVRFLNEHVAGVGEPLPKHLSRAVLFTRIVQLSRGYSPIRSNVIRHYVEMLNNDIIPVIPKYGSVGASGDLAPLAHIAYAAQGKGLVHYKGGVVKAEDAFRDVGLKPLIFEPGEVVSVINGTAYSAANLAYAIVEFEGILHLANNIASTTISVIGGSKEHYELSSVTVKQFKSLESIAREIRAEITSSSSRLQDPYSLRCTIHIHAAVLDVIEHVKSIVESEINSVSDNPIVIPDKGRVVHQCSFHGIHIALAADYLALAITTLANISERRIVQLLNPETSGLPAFLGDKLSPSGFMMTQYVAASRLAELRCKTIPYSVHNIPTSLLQEDVVSMSAHATLRVHEMLDILLDILAIEYMLGIRAKMLKGLTLTSEELNLAKLLDTSRTTISDMIRYSKHQLRARLDSMLKSRVKQEIRI